MSFFDSGGYIGTNAVYPNPLGIVKQGLVVYLDAGQVASYPGSGTDWFDLTSNNNDATLVNGVGYSSSNSGYLTFDGTNDYVTPTGLTDAFWQAEWSASFWVNFDVVNNGGADDNVMLQHGTSATRSGLHFDERQAKILFGLYGDDLTSPTTLSAGTWYNVVFTLNNTSYRKEIYLNGNFNTSAVGGGAYVGTGSNARIGGPVLAFGLHLDGAIASCSFYNRVLSAEEIEQNFNALRSRYGI